MPINREAAQWVGHELRLRRAPALGEHNREVLGALGLSEAEIDALAKDGAI